MGALELLAGILVVAYIFGVFSIAMLIRDFNIEDTVLYPTESPRMRYLWAIIWPVFVYKCIKENKDDNNL